MNNKSILDQIIISHQTDEIFHLDVIELVKILFNKLNKREQDILIKRFGLFGNKKETLEKIGKEHQLTRERIRQIEAAGIKKIKQLEDLNKHISCLKKTINQLLEEHGGLMEKEYMLNSLANISNNIYQEKNKDNDIYYSHFNFLISKFLFNEFEEIKNSKYFKNSFKLKYQCLDHLEALVEELLEKIKKFKKTLKTDELINLTKELDSYKKNEEKFKISNNLDISSILKKGLFLEKSDLININKSIYSIFKAAQNIGQSKFGHWGISNWREIKPKTINDKVYLILKNHGKPMHFFEIAKKINEVVFDKKQANVATVHNELILDKKYVLIGRGLYGLKEWGYREGAVIDVVKNILESAKLPMSRDEIINKVLEQREVKKATISLALMDKNKFERLSDGKYQLRKQ